MNTPGEMNLGNILNENASEISEFFAITEDEENISANVTDDDSEDKYNDFPGLRIIFLAGKKWSVFQRSLWKWGILISRLLLSSS